MRRLARVRELPATVQLLLVSMFLFNVGFYLVIPFLAGHLEALGLTAAMIGLILGLRTFSQQGLFFVGGALSDRFGARRMILTGVAMRIVGFLVLAFGTELAVIITGTLLTGFAAALFAPAVESTNARLGRDLEDTGVIARQDLFGLEQMCSRAGNVVGPALGAALIWAPFSALTTLSAVLFLAIWFGFHRLLPPDAAPGDAAARLTVAWTVVTRNSRFMLVAFLGAMQFGAYSLIYVALPIELSRAGSDSWLGWIYAGAAVFVIVGQPTAVRLGRMLGTQRAVGYGMSLIGLSFLAPAVFGSHLAAVIVWVVLLHAGQMLMVPPLRDSVAILAHERNLGAHYGILATLGGIIALAASFAAGWNYDLVAGGLAHGIGWAAAAAVAIGAGIALRWAVPARAVS